MSKGFIQLGPGRAKELKEEELQLTDEGSHKYWAGTSKSSTSTVNSHLLSGKFCISGHAEQMNYQFFSLSKTWIIREN